MTERTRRDARDEWHGEPAGSASLGAPLDEAVLLLRSASVADADADGETDAAARVMGAVRERPRPRRLRVETPVPSAARHHAPARPGRGRRAVLAVAALAAAAVFVVAMDGIGARGGGPAAPVAGESTPAAAATAAVRSVRFTLAAPRTARVELVGDFNAWRAGATPMRWDAASGAWAVELELPQGRYSYSFVLDGERWLADPNAPLAPDDGFGAPSSVVVVNGERRPV